MKTKRTKQTKKPRIKRLRPKHPKQLHPEIRCAIDPAAIQTPTEGPPKIRITAYTGGKAEPAGWDAPVIFDYATMQFPDRPIPILAEHDRSVIVGHAESWQVIDNQLIENAVLSGSNARTEEIYTSGKAGFPWQASITCRSDIMLYVPEGRTLLANGIEQTGPFYLMKNCRLLETSIVSIAADPQTEISFKGKISMGRTKTNHETPKQNDSNAKNVDADHRNDSPDDVQAHGQEGSPPPQANQAPAQDVSLAADHQAQAHLTSYRTQMAQEAKRIAEIDKLANQHPEIRCKAIEEGWDPIRTELEVLRANRNQTVPSPHVQAGGRDMLDAEVISCAAMMSSAESHLAIEKRFDEKTLNAADRLGPIGMKDLIRLACELDGNTSLSRLGCRPSDYLVQAASTLSLPNILANVANKSMLAGYWYTESAWRSVAKMGTVNDFKEHNRNRLTADMQFEELGPDGEIKHGTVGEQNYTIQADTYAKKFSIDRQTIINDDLSALTDLPFEMGLGANDAINHKFWTTWMSNIATFFTSGRNNYETGSTTAMSYNAMTTAITAFRTQTKPNGNPLGVDPAIILGPPEVEATAMQLMSSSSLNETKVEDSATRTPEGNTNIYRGRFKTVISAYLSNSNYTGYSTTQWFLLADPVRMATAEVAFLNGRDTPQVDQSEIEFNKLGIQLRGYIDFGVAMRDYRAGVAMKGSA
jgi:hypothetical protein